MGSEKAVKIFGSHRIYNSRSLRGVYNNGTGVGYLFGNIFNINNRKRKNGNLEKDRRCRMKIIKTVKTDESITTLIELTDWPDQPCITVQNGVIDDCKNSRFLNDQEKQKAIELAGKEGAK